MSLLKKIGQGLKNVGKKISTAVDNTAKKLASSNSPILSIAGNFVDSIIPDKRMCRQNGGSCQARGDNRCRQG